MVTAAPPIGEVTGEEIPINAAQPAAISLLRKSRSLFRYGRFGDPDSDVPVRHRFAFSLIELLVVMAILAIIAAFIAPAVSTIFRGSSLTQASQLLTAQVNLARQRAISSNREVEIRFYQFGDSEAPGEDATSPASGHFRGMQAIEVLDDGSLIPVDRMQRLPAGVLMATGARSSLLDEPSKNPAGDDPSLPGDIAKNYKYVAVRFRPDGSTTLSPSGNWFVTLESTNSAGSSATGGAKNFFTLQIDPANGTTRSYRPNAG